MKYALIGCGRVSPHHLKAAKTNGLEIVAFCDCSSENIDDMLRRASLTEEFGTLPRYADWNTLLHTEKPDMVSIALPSGLHAAAALDCIASGVHTLIEKPIAMSVQDAEKIIAAAEKHNVTVGVCHQNRFNIAVQEMRKAIDAGWLGQLSHGAVTVRWSRGKGYYDQADWRGKWASDGGTLMNQCIHGIDLLRWMLGGELVEVFGFTERRQHPYIEAEDVGVAVLKFANGAVATLEGTVNCTDIDLEEHLSVFGETGMIKLGGTSANTVEVWQMPHAESDLSGLIEKTDNVYGNGHTSLFKDFAAAVREGREPYVTAKAGRDALETVLAVYKSAAEGKPVRLPLTECSSADFTGRFDV
ncbi:MAG: Gfo/Idh/MocA family oxidoreductase [Clostridia bacterium]|nr:Gfo/Idh/MocA family oxidoreductase [Clostridia bacterium]